MAIGTLLLALALLIVVGLLIAIPLLDKKTPAVLPPTRQQLLEAERVSIIRAIRELDFDFKTGKLSSDDYKSLREEQVAQGAAVLQQLDALKQQPVTGSKRAGAVAQDDTQIEVEIEAEIQKRLAAVSKVPVSAKPARTAKAKSG